MGWRDLLEDPEKDTSVTLPWVGGRSLHSRHRQWKIEGRLPPEFGWYDFAIKGRTAQVSQEAEGSPIYLAFEQTGYLVGDRFIAFDAKVDPDPAKIAEQAERTFLIEEGLDRFEVVMVGRIYQEGPLIFWDREFPLGPEDEVREAYEDRKESVADIKGVVPALEAAFRMESHQRTQAELRRAELERLRREEEERRAREERRHRLLERLGDGAGRREMAQEDFGEAARAALLVGGAELLDYRPYRRRGEWAVKYRLERQRFECICDTRMRIIDSGICLTDHHTDEQGDTYFTLESLPAVVRQAIREHKLVVYRHV